MVDVLDLIFFVSVTAASVQEPSEAKIMLDSIKNCMPRFKLIWADGGYTGALIEWVMQKCGWVVERTFGWLTKNQRLSGDYECLTETSEALIQIAMIRIMARRLAFSG